MIQPNDLRIGNYIYDDFNEIHKVESIESKLFNEWNGGDPSLVIFSKINTNDRGMYSCDVVSGIPLTPEILEKCGFLKWNSPYTNLHIEINDGGVDGFRLDFDFMSDGNFYLKSRYDEEKLIVQRCNNIKYLHQLQNLYHSLTGKELTVKL